MERFKHILVEKKRKFIHFMKCERLPLDFNDPQQSLSLVQIDTVVIERIELNPTTNWLIQIDVGEFWICLSVNC